MKKIKKIFVFISLFLILTLSFTGSVYAERTYSNEESKREGVTEKEPTTPEKPEVKDEDEEDDDDDEGTGWWVGDLIEDLKGKAKEKYEEFKDAVSDVAKHTGSGSVISKATEKFKCSDVKYLTGTWTLIRILAPFIVILFGSLDFFKSMTAGDEKEMKKARGKFVKRMIAFILLIFLPFVVQFIFYNMGTYGSENTCLVKCIVTNDTSEKGCD